MGWLHRSVAALAAFSYAGDLAAGMPSQRFSDQPPADDWQIAGQNHTNLFANYPPILGARQEGDNEGENNQEGGGDGNKVELRILPLGASIMSGQGSPEHSGLRKWVRMALRNDGYAVNMVGSRRHGTDMKDNDHEATPGYLVNEIREALQRSLPYKPNIVMINGGTNNAIKGDHVDEMYDQMEGILEDIWGYDDMENTCVILSTLIPTEDRQGSINRVSINSAYRRLVDDYNGDKCIYLADMEPTGDGKDFISLDGDYWADSPKVHPNNEGHKRMAYVFYAAILRALRADKVMQAAPKEEEDNTGCEKEYGTGIYAGALTQVGWGHHDGTYKHNSEEKGVILELDSEFDRNQWRFARLFSPEYDDLVGWFEFAEEDHRFGVWKNSADGEGSFTKINDMNPEKYCIPRGLHFLDMNADGLDDHVCIHPNGDISVSINNGDGDGDNPPSFTDVEVIGVTGKEQDDIVLGDIDGDGRGDYGIINQDDWTLQWFRNGGTQDKTEFWEPLGKRVDIVPEAPIQWRFEDLNGDGRDDMLWVRRDGRVFTQTNTRSCEKGRHGDGLNVAWREATGPNDEKDVATGRPYTHYGMEEFHTLTEEDRKDLTDRIFFARIYGTKPAFGNFGVQDYVFIENVEDGDNWKFNVRVWKNTGSGGTKVLADGNKYGNMQAHEDGRMDYVWTWSHGKMHIFPNAEEEFIEPGGDSFWGPETVMWEPPEELDRRDLHLKDWDGDGVDDIIWVDPKNGNVRVWINEYRDKQSWDDAFHEIDPPKLECEHTRGIGIHDLAVRFADITGNGRADYLCIAKDGKVVGYTQNDEGEFEAVEQIKFADGMDRANLRWADVNGDGRDDMIWINKFNGDGTVLYNRGPGKPEDNEGSSFHWEKIEDPVYQGSQAGTCMYFPEFNGDGRADMHGIKGSWTNEAETWYNPSCGMKDMEGDDEEGVVDPELPQQEGNPLDGPGPGEEGNETPGNGDGNSEDCRELDNRDWRNKECTDKYVESHTDYSAAERWGELDGPGAWSSALEFVQCRRNKDLPEDSFSDTVSDFFNGPSGMYCELWTDSGNKCSDLALQCHDVVAPAGYHVLNSLSRIYDLGWNLYRAVDNAVQYAKDGSIADEFGLPPEESMKPSLQITLDVFLIVFGMVSGFHWNKGFGAGGANARHVKDQTNDMTKNSVTLGKDIHTASMKAKDDLGLHVAIAEAMEDMALAWKNATAQTNEKLFDGSAESNAKLDAFMEDGAMIDKESLANTEDHELGDRIKKVLNAALIPMAWKLSPDGYYPVIIREEIGCDDEPRLPWTSDSMRYVTQQGYDRRYCGENTGGVSYWLLAGENYKSTCGKFGANNPKCKRFDSPAGYDALKTNKYDVSLDELMQGAIATWEANDQKNGYKLPDVPDDAWLDQILEDGLTTPGVFNIPICTFSEARHNWYDVFLGKKKEGDNFPCDTK